MEMKKVKKDWGWEYWIVNNNKYCGKILKLDKNAFCSYHYHPIKEETFYVLKGRIMMIINQQLRTFGKRDIVHLVPGIRHTFYGLKKSKLIEFSTLHSDDDVIRLRKSKKGGRKRCIEQFLKLND